MIYIVIALTALFASFLTFFSGFGLGTILVPVFAIFYPVPIALALTAVVHLLNNIFKITLVFKNINWAIALKFGLPSFFAALFGSWLLNLISNCDLVIHVYKLFNHSFQITLLNLIVGVLIILFSIIEISKKISNLSFNQNYLILGGLLSGFFGGLSGHQGAIRSAFLFQLNLDKKVFIATGVFVACLVDVARLFFYNQNITMSNNLNYNLIVVAVISAFLGAYFGNKLFTKTSVTFFKWFVALFMFIMGLLIISGVV